MMNKEIENAILKQEILNLDSKKAKIMLQQCIKL